MNFPRAHRGEVTDPVPPLRAKCSLCNRRSVDVHSITTGGRKPFGACNECLEILRLYDVLTKDTPTPEPFRLGDNGRIHTRLMDDVKDDKIQYLLWWQTIGADGRVVFATSVWAAIAGVSWVAWLTFMVLR